MKLQWDTSFRLGLCAVALAGNALAYAQMPTPATSLVVEQQIIAASPPAAKQPHQASKGKYATPQQHEAAAVAGERHQGKGPDNPQHAGVHDFERNALRRCEVFKTEDDRSACVERVRQPWMSGSVEGGGVIREYTQTIQLPAPAVAPAGPTTLQPQPAMPVLVEPVRQ